MILGTLRQKAVYFYQHWFVRNMLTLQAGSFVGTFVQALSGVLIARILQPERYGIYALAFGVAGLTSLFLGAGVQEASTVMLGESYARRDRERTQEMLGFLMKMSLWGAAIGLLFALAAPILTQYWYDSPLIGWYAAIVVVAVVISSVWFSFVVVGLQVTGEIRHMALLTMGDQVIRMLLSVLFALVGWGIVGAMVGHLVGSMIIFIASVQIWRWLRRRYDILPPLRKLAELVRNVSIAKYFAFSFWITIDRNIATLYSILPVLFTGLFVTTSEVTFFKLAFGYTNIALSLLGPVSTLLNVEFPKMKIEDRDRLSANFSRVTWYAVGLSTLLTAGAVVTAPIVFPILYGSSFQSSVPYVLGLFGYGALFGLGVGLGPMWRAVNQVGVSIVINVLTLGLGIPLGLWLIGRYALWGSVAMVTLWYTVSHLISYLYLRRALRNL